MMGGLSMKPISHIRIAVIDDYRTRKLVAWIGVALDRFPH